MEPVNLVKMSEKKMVRSNSLASVLITIHQTLPHTDLSPFQKE